MKQISIAAPISLIVLLICCSGHRDPKMVLTQFFEALSKKDMYKARSLATAESKFTLDMLDLAMKTGSREIEIFDPAGKEFGDARINGEAATVPVKDKSGGATMIFLLKKEDGSWKVSFDNNVIMNMGIDQLKKPWDGSRNNLDNVLDEIKNLNIDSLKNSVQ